MLRKTWLRMEGDQPAEVKWNFDRDNRKPAPEYVSFDGPMQFAPDETVEDVLALVEARFGGHFGDLRPFGFATTQHQAQRALHHFISNALPWFGDYQNAMLAENRFSITR